MMKSRGALTAACFASLMGLAIFIAAWGPATDLICAGFSVREAGLGFLRTSLFAGFAGMVFVGGWLIDRLGLKTVAALGPAMLGVCVLGFAAVSNYALAAALMVAAGCAAGMLQASVNTAIAEIHSERRVFAINSLHLFFGIGALSSARASGALLGSGVSWRAVFAGIGIYLIAAGLAFLPLRFPGAARTLRHRIFDVARFSLRPVVLILSLGMLCYAGFEISLNDWGVLYFQRYFGMEKASASGILAGFWTFMTAGRLLCVFASRYLKAETLLISLSTLSFLAALPIFFIQSAATAGMLMVATGFLISGIFATLLAIGGDRFPDSIGIVSGILLACSGLGNLLFPVVIGAVAQMHSLRAALALAPGLLALLIVFSIILARSRTAS